MPTFTHSMDYTQKECVTCGCVYYVPDEVLRVKRENKEYFYCFNGHAQCFSKTASQIEKEKYDKAISEKDAALLRQQRIICDLKRQLVPSKPITRKAKRKTA